MAVNAVSPATNTVARYVQQVISRSTAQGQLSAALEEANETLAETRKEAASGDQVAIRKLAQLQKAQQMQETSAGGAGKRLKNGTPVAQP